MTRLIRSNYAERDESLQFCLTASGARILSIKDVEFSIIWVMEFMKHSHHVS